MSHGKRETSEGVAILDRSSYRHRGQNGLAEHSTDDLVDDDDHPGLVFVLAAAHLIIATGNSATGH